MDNPLGESTNVLLVEQPVTPFDTSLLANEFVRSSADQKPLASEDDLDSKEPTWKKVVDVKKSKVQLLDQAEFRTKF